MRIAVLNLNDTRRDPRVLRISQALRAAGHEVSVFEYGPDRPEHEVMPDGLILTRVPAPQDYSDAAMVELARESPAVAALIESCHPAVMQSERLSGTRRFIDEARETANSVRCRVLGKGPAPKRILANEIAAIRSILLINLDLYRAARSKAPDLVIANDLDSLTAGVMLKEACGARLIFDAHEIYAEQLSYEMRSEFWRTFYHRLEGVLAKRADGVMTVCDYIGNYFASAYGVSGVRTVLNVPALDLLSPRSVLDRRNEPRRILYHGSYFAYRGLDEIIEAIPHVRRDAVFEFRGIGAYGDVLKQKAADQGVGDRLVFRDPVPVFQLIGEASTCDIGLNPFVNSCRNTEAALPNKFFEYMMAGLATMSSDLPEMRAVTNRERVGRLFPGLKPREIASAIDAFLDNPAEIDACRERAWEAARTRYNWEQEVKVFLQFFDSVAA